MAPGTPLRPLKIAPPHQEQSDHSDSVNTSRSSSNSAPPSNSQHGGSRSRGSQTVVACMACRKRKSKCSRERPRCSTCWSKRTECVYETEEGQTRLEHLRKINGSLRTKVDDMSVIIHFLQSGSYEEAIEVLHRLRASQNMQDTVRLIRDSQLMLPDEKLSARDRMEIRKEDSIESTTSTASHSSNGSIASSLTDPSILQFNTPPEMITPCQPTTTAHLPSLASLTTGESLSLHSSPSPQSGRQTLPPLSVAVGEVR